MAYMGRNTALILPWRTLTVKSGLLLQLSQKEPRTAYVHGATGGPVVSLVGDDVRVRIYVEAGS